MTAVESSIGCLEWKPDEKTREFNFSAESTDVERHGEQQPTKELGVFKNPVAADVSRRKPVSSEQIRQMVPNKERQNWRELAFAATKLFGRP
jgi:hypothetical protein